MPRNPFRRKNRAELARERAEQAAARAEQLAARAEELAAPVPKKARRPLGLVTAGAVLTALGWAVWRALRGRSSELPQPDVTPTAPAGPADERLNDPALKAKVESELFSNGAADIPKGEIDVGAADGVVTLRGRLDSPDQSKELARAAERIEGVRRVENLITF